MRVAGRLVGWPRVGVVPLALPALAMTAAVDLPVGAGTEGSCADSLSATRAAIVAAVAAARKAHDEAKRAAAMEAKRQAVAAAVAAAQKADARKVTTMDLFGQDKVESVDDARSLARDDVREYRMQGNYGATKFIKP